MNDQNEIMGDYFADYLEHLEDEAYAADEERARRKDEKDWDHDREAELYGDPDCW